MEPNRTPRASLTRSILQFGQPVPGDWCCYPRASRATNCKTKPQNTRRSAVLATRTEGNLPGRILRRVAEKEDQCTPNHIKAQPNELEKVGRSVRHVVGSPWWNMDTG